MHLPGSSSPKRSSKSSALAALAGVGFGAAFEGVAFAAALMPPAAKEMLLTKRYPRRYYFGLDCDVLLRSSEDFDQQLGNYLGPLKAKT